MIFLLFGELSRFVTDDAHILSLQTINQLEIELAQFAEKESTQIIILTTNNEEPIEAFSHRVFNDNQIGERQKNNGVLLCIIHNQKQIRIEVGKGLEGKLVDLICGRIIREQIAPHFKEGNYDQGVLKGAQAIMEVVKGEYGVSESSFDFRGLIVGLGLFMTVMFVLMSQSRSHRGRGLHPILWRSGHNNSFGGHSGFRGGGGSSGGGGASGSY